MRSMPVEVQRLREVWPSRTAEIPGLTVELEEEFRFGQRVVKTDRGYHMGGSMKGGMMPLRAMTLRGSYVGSHGEIAELLALVNRSGMPEVPIRTRPLDEVSEALGDLRAGKVVGRVVLTPGG